MYTIEIVRPNRPIPVEQPDTSVALTFVEDVSSPVIKRIVGEPGETMMEVYEGLRDGLVSLGQHPAVATFNATQVMLSAHDYTEEDRVARANELVYDFLTSEINTPNNYIIYQT